MGFQGDVLRPQTGDAPYRLAMVRALTHCTTDSSSARCSFAVPFRASMALTLGNNAFSKTPLPIQQISSLVAK